MSIQKLGNQEVLKEAEDHWYKICGILLKMLLEVSHLSPKSAVQIREADIQSFADMFDGEMPCVMYYPKNDTITLQLLPLSEAQKKTRQ